MNFFSKFILSIIISAKSAHFITFCNIQKKIAMLHCSHVLEAKRHYLVAKIRRCSHESSFVLIIGMHSDLIVSRVSIHKT